MVELKYLIIFFLPRREHLLSLIIFFCLEEDICCPLSVGFWVQGLWIIVSPPGENDTVHTVSAERDFSIDNLLVRIHFIIEMIWWTGLAPWEFESPFPGSLISTFLIVPVSFRFGVRGLWLIAVQSLGLIVCDLVLGLKVSVDHRLSVQEERHCPHHSCAFGFRVYRGTSLIRNSAHQGPYGRPMPRDLR